VTTVDLHPEVDLRGPLDDDRTAAAVWGALGTVMDPELDEPITDLGFVASHRLLPTGAGQVDVEVHLRLPTSFCAPNFAYLMAADAQDALTALREVRDVAVWLDDHHDSTKINSGLAAGGGYRGTFEHEADDSLDELRTIFRRKAHTAAMERSCAALLSGSGWTVAGLHTLTLADLPEGRTTEALVRRRRDLGFSTDPGALVMVDDHGRPVSEDQVPLRLRFARTTRISIEGNSHFCRGLLATRYPGAEHDQAPGAYDPAVPSSLLSPSFPSSHESEH
jgi:metal-sulfur cluster biosynthetic enzyme